MTKQEAINIKEILGKEGYIPVCNEEIKTNDYHLGVGETGIFAGLLDRRGKIWMRKSDVTDEAFRAVAQYLLEQNQLIEFTYRGKRYELAVSEIEEGSEETDAGKIDHE